MIRTVIAGCCTLLSKGESTWWLRQLPPVLFHCEWQKKGSSIFQCLYFCFSLLSDCQYCYPISVSGSSFLVISKGFNSFWGRRKGLVIIETIVYMIVVLLFKIDHKSCPPQGGTLHVIILDTIVIMFYYI